MTDGLKDKHRMAIIDILSANERVERIVLFGSRAMGTFTPTSDVDIALFGDKLTLTDQSKLASDIDELPIPQRIDILIHHQIESQALLDHIQKHGVEWFSRKRPTRRKSGMGGEGWTLKRFDYCADLIRDTVRPSDVSGLPYIGLEHIAEGQLALTGHGFADQVTSITLILHGR